MSDVASGEHTLAMSVGNTGFMLDRLGEDCAPLQFLRELSQNAIEAILKLPDPRGSIVWDADWNHHTLTGEFKLSIIDTGVGMSGPEMIEYINKLSSSASAQSIGGNFGIGAKIAAATRNHEGLIYLSWVEGRGAMVHLWRDPLTGTYGLRQMQKPDGTFDHWAAVSDDIKPALIDAHGTMVVLLGNELHADTMAAPSGASSPSRWVTYYLNTRYFRYPETISIKAREGWEHPRTNTDSNILRTLTGQHPYLRDHADRAGDVDLTGAVAHWWILKDEPALGQNSGNIASSGHCGAMYQDELYEMVTGRAATARLQSFGVIFGHQRVVIYVEPDPSAQRLSANTARTHLLVDGTPLPWVEWAAEFRANMPEEIKALMEEVTAGTGPSDHRQAIRERLKQIRDLFRLSRYRPSPSGTSNVDPDSIVVGRPPSREADEDANRSGGTSRKGGGAGGQAGNIYALFLAEDGIPAEGSIGTADPEVRWITAEDGTRTPGDLEDRAARYLHEQNLLLINGDFRVVVDFIDRWVKRYDDVPGARETIRDTVREWFEQALVETVIGTRALRGSREWDLEDLKTSLSEQSLTAAIMPRYHIEIAVKRALGARLGSLKERVS